MLGINTRVELAEADRVLRERTVRRLMLEGVTIEKPETVTIDAQVRIGRDTVVEPFARILGHTVIGEDCHIGACAIVHDSELGDGVVVAPLTIVGSSRLDNGVHAGPFARLRFGNHVEAGAQVGNFVELKKTRLGAGSKALHLAYLGDAVIGKKTNIGAGTITCNYDGVDKHPHYDRRRRLRRQQLDPGCAGTDRRWQLRRGRLGGHRGCSGGRPGSGPGTPGEQAGLGQEAPRGQAQMTFPLLCVYTLYFEKCAY